MQYGPFQTSVSLTLSLWLGVALPGAVWAETDWYTLKANGQVIGKVGIHSYPAVGDQAGTVTEVSHVNHFTRQGSPFEVNSLSRFVESPQAHKALRFSYRYDLGEQPLIEAHGQLNNNALDMRLLRENTETTGQAPAGADFLFPGGEGIKQIYRQHYGDKPGAAFSYQTLHLGVQPQVVNTAVKTLHREKLALATGESKPVRKFELSTAADNPQKIYEWRDAQGKLYKSQTVGLGGMEMVYASQRQVREIDRQTIDLVNASAVMSATIPQARMTHEALYKLSPLAGQSIHLQAEFPESLMQKQVPGVKGDGANTLHLQVRSQQPADALAPFPIQFDPTFLKATPYLQVNDPQLDQTALTITGQEKRAYYAAQQLREWVYRNIAYKDLTLGFASAQETLQRQQGDCTEHAVLLAALLRAVGIPSRVAIGLIYLQEPGSELGKFVFHMWTEAYIGNPNQGDWVPLDATNPEPLTDATHIKLADSPLSAPGDLIHLTERVTNIMGKVRLDVVKALSPTQSVLSIPQNSGATALHIAKLDIERMDIQALSKQAIQHFRVDLPPAALSPDSAEGLFTSGMEAQSKGLSTQARQAFTQSLSKVRHPVALYQMGERLLAVGQYHLAKQAFTQAQIQDETLAPLVANWMRAGLPETELPPALAERFEQAIAQHYQGASASACQQFQALTQQNIGAFFPAYRGLGESCSGSPAVQAFKTALSINPNDFQSAESLGDFLMENPNPKNQGAYYEEAAQAYQRAIKSLSGQPFARSKPWVSHLEGKLHMATGAARISRNPKDPQGWLHIGKGLALQHRTQEAQQALENALALQPGEPEALMYRYQTALAQFDWAYLKAHQNQLTTLSNHHHLAAHLLAQYQMRIRAYEPALAMAQKAVALNPANGDGYETLFEIYQRMADQALWQKPPTGPQNANIFQQKAENALKTGIRQSTDFSENETLTLTLGHDLLGKNRAEEALSYTNQVLSENPLNGPAHWLRGKALFYTGQYQPAQAALKTALILLPNDPDTLTTLGQLAEEQGREAEAMDYYQQAYKADASSHAASQALRRLMEQRQVAGKKPPATLQLSPDAHDYLVQFVALNAQIENSNRAINNTRLNLHAKGNQFTISRLEALKQCIHFMQTADRQQRQFYRELENLPTPPPFSTLRFNYLQTLRQLLALRHESLIQQGVFSETQYSKIMQAAQQTDLKILETQNQLGGLLQQALGQLPLPQANGIALQAGWNPQALTLELTKATQRLSDSATQSATQPAPEPSQKPTTKQPH
ncbi:transglutaminase domain-containing protein [Vampirovibrio sp.]|uniref:transglutaminase domain-containing protein n=1 Tax=Vampirovibrio sp. TaxID=2717857 RepID=UPI00359439BC